jgi:hypothetical protein
MRTLWTLLLLAAAGLAAPVDNLPSDCCFATRFDLAGLRRTPVYARVAAPLAGFFEFIGLDEIGITPGDVASVTMGFAGEEISEDRFYLVLRGTFDGKKVATRLQADGEYAASERDGMTILTPTEQQDPDFQMPHVAILPGTLLAAPPGGLDKLMASLKPDAPISALTELLAAAPAAQVCSAAVLTPKMREAIRLEEDLALVADFKSGAIAITAGEKVEVGFSGESASEEDARRAYEAIQRELGDDLKGRIRLSRDGAKLRGAVSLSIDEAVSLFLELGVEGCAEDACAEDEDEDEGEGEGEDPPRGGDVR